MILINKKELKENKQIDQEFLDTVADIKEEEGKFKFKATNLEQYTIQNKHPKLKSCILLSKKETINFANIFELTDYIDFSEFELVAPETLILNTTIQNSVKLSLIIAFSLIRFLQLNYLVKTLNYAVDYNKLVPDLDKTLALAEFGDTTDCKSPKCFETLMNSKNKYRALTDTNRFFILNKEYNDTNVQQVLMKKQFLALPPRYSKTKSKVLLAPNTDETKISRALILKLFEYLYPTAKYTALEAIADTIIIHLRKLDLIKGEFKIGRSKLFKIGSLVDFLLFGQDELADRFTSNEITSRVIPGASINIHDLDVQLNKHNASRIIYRMYLALPKVVHSDFPKKSEIIAEHGSTITRKLNMYQHNTQVLNVLGEGLPKVVKFKEVDRKYYEQYEWQEKNGYDTHFKFTIAMSSPNSKLLRNAAYRLATHERTDFSDSVNEELSKQRSTRARYFVHDGATHLVKNYNQISFKIIKRFSSKYSRKYNNLNSFLKVEVYEKQTKFDSPFVEASKRQLRVNPEKGEDASIKLNKYIPWEDYNSSEYQDDYTKGTVYQLVMDPKKYKQIAKPFTLLKAALLGDEMAKLCQFLYKGNLTYVDKKNYSLVNGYNPFSIGNFKGKNALVRLIKKTFNYITDVTRFEFLKILKVVKPNASTHIRKYLVGLLNQMLKYFSDETILDYFEITPEQMAKFNELYTFMMSEELFFIINRRNQRITDSTEHAIDYNKYSKAYNGVRIFSQSIISTDTRILNTPLIGRVHPTPYKIYINKYHNKINEIYRRPGFGDLTSEDKVFIKIKTEVVLRANLLFNKYFDQLQTEIDPKSQRRQTVNKEGFDFIGKDKFNRIKSKIFNQILNQCQDIPERYGRTDIDIYSDILKKDISNKVLERTNLIEDYYILKPVIASYYENLDYKAVLITRYILGLDLTSEKYHNHKKYWFNNPKTLPDKFKEQSKHLEYLPVINLQ